MGGGVMLRQLALQLDILVLTWMTNLTTVGLFSGPYRISMALRVIPQTLSLPLFPLYSRTAHLCRRHVSQKLTDGARSFSLLISIPIAAFFMAWSKPILGWRWDKNICRQFPPCSFLALGLIPFFLSTLFQYLFAALDEQKRFLVEHLCRIKLCAFSFFFFSYRRFGFVGPAIAFLCAETVIVSIWMVQLARLGFPRTN